MINAQVQDYRSVDGPLKILTFLIDIKTTSPHYLPWKEEQTSYTEVLNHGQCCFIDSNTLTMMILKEKNVLLLLESVTLSSTVCIPGCKP